MNYYQTIDKASMAEYKDRCSRFIAYAFPVDSTASFKKRLKEIKAEHNKAVHHCFAYRIGTDGNEFRSSDDGEPSGSATASPFRRQDDKVKRRGLLELQPLSASLPRHIGRR